MIFVLNSGCSKLKISVSSNKVSGTVKTNALIHISQAAARKAFDKIKVDLSKTIKVDLSKTSLRGFISDQELIHYEIDTTRNQGQTCLVITPLYAKIQDYLITIITEHFEGAGELAPIIIQGLAEYISNEVQRQFGLQHWICLNKNIPPNQWIPVENKLRIVVYTLDKNLKFIEVKTDIARMEELVLRVVAMLVRGEIKISIKSQ